ncbi:MAG: zinc ABC transporter substrate-binding protein [Planctomycetaceae bacterium]|nr:zinc ABC transporter substrate-binding protein [Planctomycetaceae bacterium]
MQNVGKPTTGRSSVALCVAMAVAVLSGCEARPTAIQPVASIAVSSPYLEAAARDLLGHDAPLVALAGPSMCPGHFDMRPSQLGDLSRCKLLLRFDFQQPLDAKLSDAVRRKLNIVPITASGGLCEPEVYLSACQQIADALTTARLLEKSVAERRMSEIERRLKQLTADVHRQIESARWRGTAVLASRHQEAFCRWLGLQSVGVFSAQDTAGVGEIDAAVQAGRSARVKAIVANLPEGRRLADALADRLHAPVVVFGNLPVSDDRTPSAPAFDRLVRQNVAALLAVASSDPLQPAP